MNNDIECAKYRKKTTLLNDESEKNNMKDKDECIETIFQQWIQEEIRFFYQEIWQKES